MANDPKQDPTAVSDPKTEPATVVQSVDNSSKPEAVSVKPEATATEPASDSKAPTAPETTPSTEPEQVAPAIKAPVTESEVVSEAVPPTAIEGDHQDLNKDKMLHEIHDVAEEFETLSKKEDIIEEEEGEEGKEDSQYKLKPVVETTNPLLNRLQPFWMGLRKKLTFKKKAKLENKKDKAPKEIVKKPFFKKYKWLMIGLSLLVVIIGIFAAMGVTVYIVGQEVINNGFKTASLAQEAYGHLKNQNLVEAQTKLKETKDSLLKTQTAYEKLAWLGSTPIIAKYHEDGSAAFKAAVAGVEASEILVEAVTPYADVLGFQGQGSFMGGTVEDRIVKMVETLDKVTPELDKVSEKLEIVEAEVAKIDPQDYPEEIQGKAIRSKIIETKTIVSDITLALTDARPIVEVLPQLLGHPEGKKYLVIFQNDGELRPTGGFMSAFAVMHLDKGRVKAEKSDDIYSLDRKFGNKVEAPDVIQKYLNEKVWHLRNMNLSPDYKVSMDTFKEYYDTLPGEFQVDGIITLDTYVLEELIKVVGPIEVPGYGTFTTEMDKRCNLSQIVCELEHIIDKPLATVASNRKSDILGPMMKVLMDKSFGGGKEQLAKLMPLMFRLMAEKHILVYFTDEKAQKAAESFNIAGRIVDTQGDYLHINNANFGGAKSDFYIHQDVEQEIEIKEDGTVQKKVSISYTHTEPMDNCNLEAGQLCLSGIQRNYFRVYVPKGVKLVEALGSETEIKEGEDLGKTYFEGFFTLRPESRVKVMLVYELPFKVAKGDKYSMLIQKQPGTQNHKYTVTYNSAIEEFELNKDLEKEW